MKKNIFIITVLLTLISCSSNKEIVNKGVVKKSQERVPTESGLWYYLPKTVVEVEVTAEKIIHKVGPFYRFSQRFLNLSDVVSENKETWVISDAKITTYGIPDKEKLFSINTTGLPSLAAISLDENGVLRSVNLHQRGKRKEDIKEFVKPIKSIEEINFDDVPYTEEQLIKTSTAAMAEEVAKEIYRLRALRKDILEGEIDNLPPDGYAYEQTLAEIKRQEQAYLELFTGKKIVQKQTKVFKYIPEKDYYYNDVLFRFSEKSGFLRENDVSGTPVYIEFEVLEGVNEDLVSQENEKDASNRGLIYCQPGVANVKIIDRTVQLIEKDVNIAQFGKILRMPADILENKDAGVILDGSTGAVKNVVIK